MYYDEEQNKPRPLRRIRRQILLSLLPFPRRRHRLPTLRSKKARQKAFPRQTLRQIRIRR